MQDLLKCNSCSKEFDLQTRIPFLLPCNHNICSLCLQAENNRTDQTKCPKCKVTINAQTYGANAQITSELEQRTKNKAELINKVNMLKEKRKQFKQAIQMVIQYQAYISQNVRNLIKQFIFPMSNQTSKELKVGLEDIDNRINNLESLLNNKNFTQMNIGNTLKHLDMKSLENKLNRKLKEIQIMDQLKQRQVYIIGKTLELASKNLPERYEEIFENLQAQTNKKQQSTSDLKGIQQLKNGKQSQKSKLIHIFGNGTHNLHIFNVEKEEYKLVKVDKEVPYGHSSVECDGKIYIVGGEIFGIPLKTT